MKIRSESYFYLRGPRESRPPEFYAEWLREILRAQRIIIGLRNDGLYKKVFKEIDYFGDFDLVSVAVIILGEIYSKLKYRVPLGSDFVDAVAILFEAGFISNSGRLKLPREVNRAVMERVFTVFLETAGEASAINSDAVLFGGNRGLAFELLRADADKNRWI